MNDEPMQNAFCESFNGRSAELVGVAEPIARCGEERGLCRWREIAEPRFAHKRGIEPDLDEALAHPLHAGAARTEHLDDTAVAQPRTIDVGGEQDARLHQHLRRALAGADHRAENGKRAPQAPHTKVERHICLGGKLTRSNRHPMNHAN